MRIKFCFAAAFVIAAVLLEVSVYASTGSCCLIPTVDMLQPMTARFSYESDGHTSPYDKGYTQYAYSQFGINDRLEVGVDVYDFDEVGGDKITYYNGKYLLMKETPTKPAVAVGAMYVGKTASPNYFAVGCKTFGKARLHFGAQTDCDDTWALLGADYALGHGLSLLTDYQSGESRWHAGGLYWQMNSTVGLTFYYVSLNKAWIRNETNYYGFNVAYTIPLK